MKYLKSFHRKLARLMDEKGLDIEGVATLCAVDPEQVDRWLSKSDERRTMPTTDQLLDLCLRTSTSLERVLDIDTPEPGSQLELPGLAFVEDSDLVRSLDQLGKQIEAILPSDQEIELLRRFRRSSEENRKLIIQLMN